MSDRHVLKVSKTDAAKRQLETAVRLWFHSHEPVSIHTLAAAAHQILHDLGKKSGTETALRGLPGVRPEFVERARTAIARDENFFKHADRDPDKHLTFNPDVTELFLLDAVVTYEAITGEHVPILTVFKAWMFLAIPEAIAQPHRERLTEAINASGIDLAHIPKAKFFNEILPKVMSLGLS